MINRELIRLKVVQLVYAYNINDKSTWSTAQKELDLSLSKAYDLYLYQLLTLTDIHALANLHLDTAKARIDRLKGRSNERMDERVEALATNKLLSQLAVNNELQARRKELDKRWDDEDIFIAAMFKKFLESPQLAEYLATGDRSYSADKQLIRRLFKACYIGNEQIAVRLEENGIYWNDDKHIVDSFVTKTLKKFSEEAREEQPLEPEFAAEADRIFAFTLFEQALANKEELHKRIAEACIAWRFERLATMDISIVQTALTEVLHTDVPIDVTFNEYLNIAKVYSTPESSRFINGLLDAIVRRLRDEHRVLK